MTNTPASIVFLGTSAFAVPSLQALAADPHFSVKLVITQPDRPTGRKQILTPPPVKVAALALSIPVEQPEKLEALRLSPDFLVVVSYGQILPKRVLEAAHIAAVNVHASLLPHLRGASPIQHTILEGATHGGVTVQKMVAALDAGDVLAQSSRELFARETYQSLHDQLAKDGATLLVQTLKKPLEPKAQDETLVTFCRKLTRENGIADPKTMNAVTIDRMVRALSPWPGVKVSDWKILETSLTPSVHAFPLPCADETVLYVTKVQPAGGKPMEGSAFARGRTDILK